MGRITPDQLTPEQRARYEEILARYPETLKQVEAERPLIEAMARLHKAAALDRIEARCGRIPSMIDELWLVHPDEAMSAALAARFAGLPGVRLIQSRFEDLEPHDAFVTAGNAFGIMTAGIDAAVVRRFGENVMRQVQDHILDAFHGEQPVGTAFVVTTGDPDLPFLVHAPTMRVPGNIAGTDKVYGATWAALLAIQAHNRHSEQKIRVAAFPAMGTGFGGVPYDEAARQMAAAWRHFLEPPHRLDWDTVIVRQKAICYDGDRQVL